MLMETDELHAYVDANLARCMDLHIERIFRQASQAAQALKRQQPDPPIVHRIRRGLLRILRAIEHRLDERSLAPNQRTQHPLRVFRFGEHPHLLAHHLKMHQDVLMVFKDRLKRRTR